MSLLFNTLSRFVIAFLPRSMHLLISRLQALSAVILEPKKIKSVTASTLSLSICHEIMGPDAMILVFWMLSFKPAFLISSFTLNKRLFSYDSAILLFRVYSKQMLTQVSHETYKDVYCSIVSCSGTMKQLGKVGMGVGGPQMLCSSWE